jgi:gluconate kinase
MLIILFGLSGSGKNFVAEIMARHFHFHFFDADTLLPQPMLDCIQQKKMFTQAMRDDFTKLVINKITELKAVHKNLVIAQAFYKEKNRSEVHKAFPHARFIYVRADLEKIISRLQKSIHNIDAEYAAQISIHFEDPKLSHSNIVNNTNEADVISQLQNLLHQFH